MSNPAVVRPPDPIVGTHVPARLERLRIMTRLLDTAFTIPGTGIRFGLDGIIGLVPGLGDAVSAVLSGYLVLEASRMGAPRSVINRMVANVAIDTLVGWIPLLGDIFDVVWKSNVKNMALLEEHVRNPAAAKKGSRRALLLLGGGLVVVLAGTVALGIVVGKLVLDLLQ